MNKATKWMLVRAISLVVAISSTSAAVTKCSAKANAKNGVIDVSASGIAGPVLWGDRSGAAANAFFNAGTCIHGSMAGKCELGATTPAVTPQAITPPDPCTIYLKDDGAECSAYVRGCTPGTRSTDQTKADDLKNS
jgi:hypothetical protein